MYVTPFEYNSYPNLESFTMHRIVFRVLESRDHHDYLKKESIIESERNSSSYSNMTPKICSREERKVFLEERRKFGMLTSFSRNSCWGFGRYCRWVEGDSCVSDCCHNHGCGCCIQWGFNRDRFMSYHRVSGGGNDGKPSDAEGQKRVDEELHIFFGLTKNVQGF